MGNHIVCCRQKWSQLYESEEKINTDLSHSKISYSNPAASFNGDVWRTSSAAQLSGAFELNTFPNGRLTSVNQTGVTQHISEREPEDTEFDPSLNASRHALFISGFRHDLNSFMGSHSHEKAPNTPGPTCHRAEHVPVTPSIKRWSSCSTIFIGDSCLAHPNQKSTLWSVSIAVGLLIRSEKNNHLITPVRSLSVQPSPKPLTPDLLSALSIYEDVYSLFDERTYLIERYPADGSGDSAPPDLSKKPKAPDVHQFLCRLFNTALLGPECAIVALIFLERLVNAAEVGILPWSWRRQLLACVLLASKVLDDQAVWNTDYCQILRDVCVDDLNALERHTLSLLQFNIDVPPAVYARYYFDLLYVAQASGVANQPAERRRLTAELAQQLRLLPARTADACRTNAGMLFDLPLVDSSIKCKPRPSAARHPEATASVRKRSKKHATASRGPKSTAVDSCNSNSVCRMSGLPAAEPPVSSSGSAAMTVKPTVDTYLQSEIMFTLEPIPPARTPEPDDEGPLRLDDETDLINTLTAESLLGSSALDEVLPTSSCNQPAPTRTTASSTHARIGQHNRWITGGSYRSSAAAYATDSSEVLPVRWTTTIGQQSGCDPALAVTDRPVSNSSGFIRTLMGGDVAYSLLRDAGMY